ncbi:MAG: TonB-dependent receptor [Terriglobales bacterium]|jgi:iron complex outermembrane recepter protein
MSSTQIIRYCLKFAMVAFIVSLATVPTLFAQAEKPLTWLDDLNYLDSIAKGDVVVQQDAVANIRIEVERWINLHPNAGVILPDAPVKPWSAEQTASQIQVLRQIVELILKQDSDHPFHLGVTQVSVAATVSPLSPVADSIAQSEINKRDATNVAVAADYLPGVSIQHLAMNRNEYGIMVRGFSTRGQVPVYEDGIPIYVPYDGYIDFKRYLSSDVAEIQVARGYSSPLLGPNALGGTINLVTKQPQKKFEGDGAIGTGSGDTLLASLRMGTRWDRFFAQGTVDWLQDDYLPLSGNFQYPAGGYAALTPGNPADTNGNVPVPLTDHMNQSYAQDERYAGRVGWTPRGSDQYVFSYDNQKGQKGVPLYAGSDANAKYRFYWKWPFWDKTSYYFLSNTGLGERSSIKFRALYDQFDNGINMFDNDTYSTMSSPNSEFSKYYEHTDGASTEFTTRVLPRNVIGASFFFKDDTHRERGIFPSPKPPIPAPLVEPYLVDRDQQTSIGLQDEITLAKRLRAMVGFSADHFNGLQGQSYNTANTGLVPFTCLASPNNTSFAGCTLHTWNVNPQASLSYTLSQSDTLFMTFADRGRFPMLKDIYSAGMLSGLPNPNLLPEHSRNWNVGYSHIFAAKTLMQVELFRSDLRNAIESAYVTDPGYPSNPVCPNSRIAGFCSENLNIGSEAHEGVEFEVRSTPVSRLTLDVSYSYLNRTIAYDFSNPDVSKANTSISILPTLPKNKLVGSATVRLPRQVQAFLAVRYEGGLTLQDTNYPNGSPLLLPYGESYATMDLGTALPIRDHITLQAGVKNLLDRNYFYTAGYPEEGRNWFLNMRFRF